MPSSLTLRYYVWVVLAGTLTGCGDQPTVAPALRSVETQSDIAVTHRGDVQFIVGYDAGYRQAMSAGRPMLVFFTAEWCTYCHQMAEDAFRQPDIVTLANRFVCVLVDADAQRDVCDRFGVRGYPTVQFISPRGVPLGRLVGRQPAGRLGLEMLAALEASARELEPAGETARRWRVEPTTSER